MGNLEIDCPECKMAFNSEEEMLNHYDEVHSNTPKNKRHSKKKTLAVVLITILIASSAIYCLNDFLGGRDIDTDGDGITDWYETHVSHTDPTKIDTSGLGLDDFNAFYTYNIDPNNHTAVKQFLENLPNVTANLWNFNHLEGYQGVYQPQSFTYSDRYYEISLRDPLIKYLASETEIKWGNSTKDIIGHLIVNGDPFFGNYGLSNDIYVGQPSYFFTHDRRGNCVESSIAEEAIFKLMGYKSVLVSLNQHETLEVVIDGRVCVADYGKIIPREEYYVGRNVTFSSNYDPNWYLK